MSADPERINPGETSGLVAIPGGGAPPYTWVWTPADSLDDATIGSPTASPATTTTYDVTITDVFGAQAFGSVTVTVGPDLIVVNAGGGEVTSDPAGIVCGSDCTLPFDSNSIVELTAAPDAGFAFDGWGMDCSSNNPVTQVTMDANKTCEARFSQAGADFLLTVDKDGAGNGTVTTVGVAGIDCGNDCSEAFPAGTDVTLLADPNPADPNWSGWAGCDGGDGVICEVTLSSDRTVTATFD